MKEKNLTFYLRDFIYAILFITLIIVMICLPSLKVVNAGEEEFFFTFFALMGNTNLTIGNEILNIGNSNVVLIIGFVSLLLSVITAGVGLNFYYKDKVEIGKIIYLVAIGLLALFLFIFALSNAIVKGYIVGEFGGKVKLDLPLSITSVIFVLLMIFILFSRIFGNEKFSIQNICEIAVLVALAVVLDTFAKIPVQANGGSISFAALPLFLISIRMGGFKGFIASSFIFGFITCLLDGYGFQTFPFDYFVAYAGYGFVGFFVNLFNKFNKNGNKGVQFGLSAAGLTFGVIVAVFFRYLGAMIDGFILYQPITFVDNFIYQSTYIPLSMLVSYGGALALLEPMLLINRVFKVNNYKKID